MDFMVALQSMFAWVSTTHIILLCWVGLMAVIGVNWLVSNKRRAGEKGGFVAVVQTLRGKDARREDTGSQLRRPGR
ncbi:MAG: hypothetical protein AAGI50_19160 [Pseudomonadota bacterium]